MEAMLSPPGRGNADGLIIRERPRRTHTVIIRNPRRRHHPRKRMIQQPPRDVGRAAHPRRENWMPACAGMTSEILQGMERRGT